MSIYDFQVKTIDGKNISMKEFSNQVLLIVNVASQCGFTPQYESLEKLYQKYRDKGFSVLGFPCNQFGSQEPGTEDEIKKFCTLNYNVTFPLFSKIFVNGPQTHPLFAFLKSHEKGILGTEAIKWNFTKFLIDRLGNPTKRYSPQVNPIDLAQDIEKLFQMQSKSNSL